MSGQRYRHIFEYFEIIKKRLSWDFPITRHCVRGTGKRSIKNPPCYNELISGSSHRQKCSTISTQKSNVGLKTQPTLTVWTGKQTRHGRGDLVPAFTLAEVFLPYYHSPRKVAFTLAEVLITLGIIGVVAAMTLPMLIAKHQKITTVTQLQKAYSTLAQAFTMAQKDYGDISQWEFKPENPENGDTQSLQDGLDIFANRYLIPYLKIVTLCKGGNQAKKDCSYDWYTTDGTKLVFYYKRDNSYRFVLNNTNLIELHYDNAEGDYTSGSILIYVDINGMQKPNTIGKDIFVMSLRSNTSKLKMFGEGLPRDTLLNQRPWGCANKGSASNAAIYCGALIQNDGWQIKDDYPWF